MSLIRNSEPAERQRGCFFAENFDSRATVEANNGVVFGSPTFGRRVNLNGTSEWLEYNVTSPQLPDRWSFFMKYIPYFDPDENVLRRFMHTSNGFSVLKLQNSLNNALRIVIDGIIVADIAYATYSPHWKTNEVNGFFISSRSFDTDIWLNGTRILNNDVSAWAFSALDDMAVGGTLGGGGCFYGEVLEVRMFDRKLSNKEAEDYTNNEVFDYRNRITVDLPMLNAQDDPGNTRTLDISGNANHAVWTAGATAPAKNTFRPGYDWDGTNDLMTIASSPENTFGDGTTDSPFSLSFWIWPDDLATARAVYKRVGGGNSEYQIGAPNGIVYFNCFDQSTGGYIGRTNPSFDVNDLKKQPIHVVGTYDGTAVSDGMAFYINGQQGDTNDSLFGSYTAMENTGQGIVLGSFSTGFMDGGMAHLKIYDRELTKMQVADLYTREQNQLNNL